MEIVSLLWTLFHQHHWGLPRRREDGRLEMECFDCCKCRPLRVMLDDQRPAQIKPGAPPEMQTRS